MKRRGISTVVATILIVLIAVIAVVIVWSILKPLLEKTTKGISTNCLEVDLEVASASCNNTNHKADVSVKLNSGKIAGLKLIFSNGNESAIVERTDIPEELATKAYTGIDLTLDNVSSVNAAGVIVTEAGENETCTPTGTAKSC